MIEKINQSHLGVITPSKFNYFLQKYIEIPLCNCCPLGNLPKNNILAKELYKNDFIDIIPSMTDSQIINITKNALKNKKLLLEKSYNIRKRSSKFNSQNYSKTLYNISNVI